MHLASLMQPLSSCCEYLYNIPTITAFFLPCTLRGGPGGMWLYIDEGGGTLHKGKVEKGGGGGGAGAVSILQGLTISVTAWHSAHRIAVAPAGSCNGVRQSEQFTSIGMVLDFLVTLGPKGIKPISM